MQSGAPHSILGTYVEMMQHASLLKRAVAVSFLTIAAVQSVCRHSHPSPAAAASQSAASAHTVGGVRGREGWDGPEGRTSDKVLRHSGV